jgi:hypothetical protein
MKWHAEEWSVALFCNWQVLDLLWLMELEAMMQTLLV